MSNRVDIPFCRTSVFDRISVENLQMLISRIRKWTFIAQNEHTLNYTTSQSFIFQIIVESFIIYTV